MHPIFVCSSPITSSQWPTTLPRPWSTQVCAISAQRSATASHQVFSDFPSVLFSDCFMRPCHRLVSSSRFPQSAFSSSSMARPRSPLVAKIAKLLDFAHCHWSVGTGSNRFPIHTSSYSAAHRMELLQTNIYPQINLHDLFVL